jgi:chromosome segregation ATPase
LLTVGGDEAHTLGLRYSDFVAPIVKSVQELNAKLEALEAENQKLKTALLEAMNEKEKLASENKDLESKVNTIQGDVDEIKRVLNISASKN